MGKEMVHAFIFINTEPGSETEVLHQMRQKPEVREAHRVQGIYDLVAKVETESTTQLREIAEKIRGFDHVRSILVLMTIYSEPVHVMEIRQERRAEQPSTRVV
jgi:DNA-binding Lrp family transcriptional regulator